MTIFHTQIVHVQGQCFHLEAIPYDGQLSDPRVDESQGRDRVVRNLRSGEIRRHLHVFLHLKQTVQFADVRHASSGVVLESLEIEQHPLDHGRGQASRLANLAKSKLGFVDRSGLILLRQNHALTVFQDAI